MWWHNFKRLFVKREPLYGESIFEHRTWLDKVVQEEFIKRENNSLITKKESSNIIKPGDNWYDKYYE